MSTDHTYDDSPPSSEEKVEHGNHHPLCEAGEHDGLCSATDDEGATKVFGVTDDGPSQSYVSRGTEGTWDGRRETADDPYSPQAEIEKLQAARSGK